MNETAVSPRADHEVAGEWKAAFSWPGAGRHLPRPPYKVCPKFVINDRKLENRQFARITGFCLVSPMHGSFLRRITIPIGPDNRISQ